MALGALCLPTSAQAIDSFWAIDSSGNWHMPNNWNPPIVPNNNGTITFNVTIDRPSANPLITVDLPPVTISNLVNRELVRLPGGQSLSVIEMLINDATPSGPGTLRADNTGNVLSVGTLNNVGAILINTNGFLTISPLPSPAPPPQIIHHGGITIQTGGTLSITGGTFIQQGAGTAGSIIGIPSPPPSVPATLAISNVFYAYQGGSLDVPQWLVSDSTVSLGAALQITNGNLLQMDGASFNSSGSPGTQLISFGANLRAVGGMSTMSVPLVLFEGGSFAIDTGTTFRCTVAPVSATLIKVTVPGEIGTPAVWSFGPGTVNTFNSGPVEVIEGDLTITHDANSSQFTNTGPLTVAALQKLTLHNGSFVHNGGPSAGVSNAGVLRAESGGTIEINNTAVTGGGGLEASGATIRLNSSTLAANKPINIISTMAVSSVLEIKSGSSVSFGVNAPITVGSSMTVDSSTTTCDAPICVINGFAPSSELSVTNAGDMTLSSTSKLDSKGCVQVQSGSALGGTGDINIQNGATEGTQNGALICSGSGTTVLAGDVLLESGTSIDVSASASVGSKGNFLFALQDEANWSWAPGTNMRLTGGIGMGSVGPLSYARLEVGGMDVGFDPATHTGNPAGFVDNFDLAELRIGPGAHVTLVDCFDNGNGASAPEALYVDTLRFESSTSRLNLNGIHLYFNTLIGVPGQIEDVPSGIPGPVDCDTDLADFAGLQNCYGHSAPFMVPCGSYDLDGNLTIANPDYVLFQQTFNGPD
jgi:hypothetical protein